MEIIWYKFRLQYNQSIQEILDEFSDLVIHYPELEGNSVCSNPKNDSLPSTKHTYYFSLNSKIKLYGEIFHLKYDAITCLKPLELRYLWKDGEKILDKYKK